jgi:hypothetical protein
MPAGDAQRAWFPDMLSELEGFWGNQPGWEDVICFCEIMTSLRTKIREQRGIRPLMMRCRSCGGKHAATIPPISPRSLLFALQKIEAIDDQELKRLDKEWMRFRKTENLDARGYPKAEDSVPNTRDEHLAGVESTPRLSCSHRKS